MITISQNLASIIGPLYADIHSTFANPQAAVASYPLLTPKSI